MMVMIIQLIEITTRFNFVLILTDYSYKMCSYEKIFNIKKGIIMVVDGNDDDCNSKKVFCMVIMKLIVNILMDIIMTRDNFLLSQS